MSANEPNADQVAYWNGPVGERWAAWQAKLDHAFSAFADRVVEAAALMAGDRVLDVGCGCGVTAVLASSAVGSTGSVVGVDVSAPMIERARLLSTGRGNIHYVLADAATEDFEKSFDVALSRFGVMFFDDPVAAFANLHAALVPGGRIAFACWRALAENPWSRIPEEIAKRFVDAPPRFAPGGPGPFAFADRAHVESILAKAGFTNVSVDAFDADVVLSEEGPQGAVDFATGVGPGSAAIRDASDEKKAEVRAAMLDEFRALSKEDHFVLPGAVWIVRASA
ncbi:MAG TPA: methyltransferase domain-containing protein [Polyangiaceae bacterium]